jgi:hypothetical protein
MGKGSGGGKWIVSHTNLKLAVGLQHESVKEKAPSQSPPLLMTM